MRPFPALAATVCAFAIASFALSPVLAAKQKPAPKTAAPTAPAARPDSTSLTQPTPPVVARSPGPLVKPGSPIVDRTTIAPFPVPGDTSRAAIARSKQMNVPRVGETLLEPPPRTGGWKLSGSNIYWDPGDVTRPLVVDVLPEQLTAPAPEYPKAARDAGIQGVVLVMAWVKTDGMVDSTRVVRSIPALDAAAVQSVKRLRFKPAMAQGKPVAVWVGIPVRFTIH
jgi:protein TonB